MSEFDFKNEIGKEIRKTFFGENRLPIFRFINNDSFQKNFELLIEHKDSYGTFETMNYISFIQEFGADLNNGFQNYFKSNEFKESDFDNFKENYEILLRSIYFKAIEDEFFEDALDCGYVIKGYLSAFKKVYKIELIEDFDKFIQEINEQQIVLKQKIQDGKEAMQFYFVEHDTKTNIELEAKETPIELTSLEQELIKEGFIGEKNSNVAPMPLHPILKKSTQYLYENTKMDWLGERIALLYLFNLLHPNSLQDIRLKINLYISKYYTFKEKSITIKQVEKLKSYLISKHINNTQKMKPDYLQKIEEIVSRL